MFTPIDNRFYYNYNYNISDHESFEDGHFISSDTYIFGKDIDEMKLSKDYTENFMLGEIKEQIKYTQQFPQIIDKENDAEFKSENYIKITEKETQKENSEKEEEDNGEKNFLNKKTKESNDSDNRYLKKEKKQKKKHTKYSDDNMRRKCKHIVINSLFNFINHKIYDLYNGNIGKGIKIKQLQKLNPTQKSKSNIQFNKEFLQKPLRDIFSDKLSGRITFFCPEHNKKLIERLLNENDIVKKVYFNDLFNLSFLQCLEHFRGSKFYYELNGMDDMRKELKNYEDKEYAHSLEYYLNNYEKIINNKYSKKSRKKNTIN